MQLANGAGGKGASIPSSEKTSAKESRISLGCLIGPGEDSPEGAQGKTDSSML